MSTEKFSIKQRFAWVFLPMHMFRGNKELKIFEEEEKNKVFERNTRN